MLLPAIGGSLHGAVIRGVIVENLTGKPLSRTQVTVQPISGTPGSTLRLNTTTTGGFDFSGLAAGAYIVTASRRNFATVQYGQKDFQSAGLAIILEQAASTFLNIRMPRLGAISGRVVDGNDVGIPEHDVVIYRNTRPPQMLTKVRADERGAFRFYGLEPGWYLLRTAAREYDEGSYLPTFARETTRVEDARAVQVGLDQEVNNFDVSPKTGRLYKIGGTVFPGVMTADGNPAQVKLTMAGDMGREEAVTSGPFRFPPVVPGGYEFYAEGPGDGRFNCFMIGAYQTLEVKDRDRLDIQVPVPCVRETQVAIYEKSGQWIDPRRATLLVRRKDMAGTRETRTLPISGGRIQLAPGRWEVLLRPPANYCVVEFSFGGMRPNPADRGRADGWNEVRAESGGMMRFTLSANPGALHGLVSGLSHEPVAGAPVYLEGYDPEQRKRVTDLVVGLTDSRGQYQFRGLAPGSYRVLSTFEFQHPDVEVMDRSGAKLVNVQEGGDTPQDLDLSVIR